MRRYDMRMDGEPCGTLQVLVTKARLRLLEDGGARLEDQEDGDE